ncbi:MAG: LysM peptidoglycan-binding domain-containing protein [Draconibacterium sp.]
MLWAIVAGFSNFATGQDSLFQVNVQHNLTELDQWCNEIIVSKNQAIHFHEKTDTLSKDFSLLNQTIFNKELPGFSSFYTYYQQLPVSDKEYLLNAFSYWKPVLEKEILAAGLPAELEYLPMALSVMNVGAVGADKKAGLWQLTHFQGILNGLEINRLVDERFVAEKATRAAVAEIQKSTKVFGNQEWGMLGFLAGNTALRNAMLRCGDSISVNCVLENLPKTVQQTLTAWQALAVFQNNYIANAPFEYLKPDTVLVQQKMHFQQVEQVLDIPLKTLQELNPQFRYLIIPGDKNEVLTLPEGKREAYIVWHDSIFNAFDSTLFDVVARKVEYPPAPTRQYIGEKVKDLEIEGKVKIKYTLQRGDVLGYIAEDYNVQVEDLKYWNNIYNERKIQAGQQLVIFVDENEADYFRSLQKQPAANAGQGAATAMVQKTWEIPASAHKVEHVVKNGESPYVIAKKYDGVTPEAILYWNGISDARKIQIGQKLTIYVSE